MAPGAGRGGEAAAGFLVHTLPSPGSSRGEKEDCRGGQRLFPPDCQPGACLFSQEVITWHSCWT